MARRGPLDRQHYIDLGRPISFAGRGVVRRYSRPKPSHAQVEDFLSSIDSYTKHRDPAKIKFNPVFVHRLRELIQMDLCDKQLLSGANDGYKYWLIVQDTFSRYVWCRPLKNKLGPTVARAFEHLLQYINLRGTPEKCLSDRGVEFRSRDFKRVLEDYDIMQLFPIFHAPHVERVQRTLQGMVAKYQTEHGTDRYIHILQDVIQSYNRKYHRIIKTSPEMAEQTRNGNRVRFALSEYYQKARESRKSPKYTVNTWVRVRNTRGPFFRSYQQTFGDMLYQIHKVHKNLPRPLYELKDSASEVMLDRYYEEELQPVTGDIFKVSSLLGRRRNRRTGQWERLVNWVGFIPGTGTWEPENTLNLHNIA